MKVLMFCEGKQQNHKASQKKMTIFFSILKSNSSAVIDETTDL